MSISLIVLWAITAAAALAVALLPGRDLGKALGISGRQALRVVPLVIPAIVAAGFIGQLLPERLIAAWMGDDSGFLGILAASALGSIVPTGPMVVLPIAAALLKAGAGVPQICALVGAWSVMNFHRLFLWELPILGAALTTRRFVTGLLVTPLTGLFAQAVVWATS